MPFAPGTPKPPTSGRKKGVLNKLSLSAFERIQELGLDPFKELARMPAIEGKTWNHPVLVGDILLVRNGEEMVAFRLSLAGR